MDMLRHCAAIFDLDGVLVDTAKYHFLAWKRLAGALGIEFSETDNERLKGVSRDESLMILLDFGGLQVSATERTALAEKKNCWYIERISQLDESDLLPGASEYLTKLRAIGIPIALASASRNARAVLDRLKIAHFFSATVDGNQLSKAKPDPEIFLLAAAQLGHKPAECVVFEDASAGIAAALAAGMFAVGIGQPTALASADFVVPDLAHCDIFQLFDHGIMGES